MDKKRHYWSRRCKEMMTEVNELFCTSLDDDAKKAAVLVCNAVLRNLQRPFQIGLASRGNLGRRFFMRRVILEARNGNGSGNDNGDARNGNGSGNDNNGDAGTNDNDDGTDDDNMTLEIRARCGRRTRGRPDENVDTINEADQLGDDENNAIRHDGDKEDDNGMAEVVVHTRGDDDDDDRGEGAVRVMDGKRVSGIDGGRRDEDINPINGDAQQPDGENIISHDDVGLEVGARGEDDIGVAGEAALDVDHGRDCIGNDDDLNLVDNSVELDRGVHTLNGELNVDCEDINDDEWQIYYDGDNRDFDVVANWHSDGDHSDNDDGLAETGVQVRGVRNVDARVRRTEKGEGLDDEDLENENEREGVNVGRNVMTGRKKGSGGEKLFANENLRRSLRDGRRNRSFDEEYVEKSLNTEKRRVRRKKEIPGRRNNKVNDGSGKRYRPVVEDDYINQHERADMGRRIMDAPENEREILNMEKRASDAERKGKGPADEGVDMGRSLRDAGDNISSIDELERELSVMRRTLSHSIQTALEESPFNVITSMRDWINNLGIKLPVAGLGEFVGHDEEVVGDFPELREDLVALIKKHTKLSLRIENGSKVSFDGTEADTWDTLILLKDSIKTLEEKLQRMRGY